MLYPLSYEGLGYKRAGQRVFSLDQPSGLRLLGPRWGRGISRDRTASPG